MNIRTIEDPDHIIMEISGFGANKILQNENGIHVMEEPHKNSKVIHTKVSVYVEPVGSVTSHKDSLKIIRRYQYKPTPWFVILKVNGAQVI